MSDSESMTITVLIGNSDNKLSQVDWHRFCRALQRTVQNLSGLGAVHFAAPSVGDAIWQNFCMVFELSGDFKAFTHLLGVMCTEFHQDSIAITLAETIFIKPPKPANSGNTGKTRTPRKNRI